MKSRNRHRYRNSVRLPVILFFVITGGLISSRWLKEIRAQHQAQILSTEVRGLDHAVTMLRRDIKDLNSRYSALVTQDVIKAKLKEKHIEMRDIATNTIISLESDKPADVAANLDQ